MYKAFFVSDLDGTLLPEGNKEINPEVFDCIRKLKDNNIAFCAASGRSFGSLKELFAPVADDIFYLSENSAEIHAGETLLKKIFIPTELAKTVVESIAPRRDCYARVNTEIGHYYVVPDEETAAELRKMEYADATAAYSFDDIQGNVTQITACSFGDITIPAAELIPMWKDKIDVVVTGEHWLDFTTAGKGVGVKWLCQHLGIALNDVYAFGDNYNDVSMLDIVGHPYIMEEAAHELLAKYNNKTGNVAQSIMELLK